MTRKPIPKKNIVRRLKIIQGHLKKITEMVEENRYCVDVLHQTSAVKNALKEVDVLLLDNHLRLCIKNAVKNDKGEKSIQELLKILKKANT